MITFCRGSIGIAWPVWCNGYGVCLQLERSQIRLPAVPLPGSDLEQVVHTRVSGTSHKGSDVLRLGR